MKKLAAAIVIGSLSLSSVALAEPMIIDLEAMTPTELTELKTMVSEEYDRATEISSSDASLLEKNFKEAFRSIIPADADASYPFFGLDKQRARTMYKVSGECTAKFSDKSKTKYDMTMIYWYNESDSTFHQVAFYSDEKVYYCDNELLPNVAQYLKENVLEKLNADEIAYHPTTAEVTPVPTQTPAPTPIPTPTPTLTPQPTEATQEAYIEDALKRALGSQYIKFENNNNGDNINVYFELGAAWNNKMYKTGFFMNCVDILQALDELADLGKISFETVYLEADTDFVDTYGNPSKGKAMTLDITHDTIAQINWERFLRDNLETIATDYWCHQALKD